MQTEPKFKKGDKIIWCADAKLYLVGKVWKDIDENTFHYGIIQEDVIVGPCSLYFIANEDDISLMELTNDQ